MFGTTGSFDKTQFLLERAMDASVLRRSAIADNIANVDTPHFKRSEVTFESQLARALSSGERPRFQAKMTNGRHIPFDQPMDYRDVRARIQIEHETNFRNDKNNVDIEKEVVDATKNMLLYNAYAQRVDKNYKNILMIVRG
jgi:flagellar basal-body rod protein FlgB